MKKIQVVAAIIQKDEKTFATQRGYGDFKGGWEFPGGKVEEGEELQEALVREIREELDIFVTVHDLLITVYHQYPQFHLTMHCFLCSIEEGEIELIEHQDGRWLAKDELDSVAWLEADIDVVNRLKEMA